MQLVIASTNLHKIREIRAILRPQVNLDILSLHDFPDYRPPPETGATFEENAFAKATYAATALKKWVIADDSGLVIPALGGKPGVYSSRFAGENATDKENREKLLQELDKIGEEERIGYYACAMALASPDGIQKQVYATCEGRLCTEERGGQGFGYDPLFIKSDYNKTLAEIDEATKNRISHRRKALDKLLPALEQLSLEYRALPN